MKRARSQKFRRLGDVLPDVVKKLRLAEVVAAAPIVSAWPELVGPTIARHSRALTIEDGRLVVVVDSPAWLAQLNYLAPQLLSRIRTRTGGGTVRDFRFILSANNPNFG